MCRENSAPIRHSGRASQTHCRENTSIFSLTLGLLGLLTALGQASETSSTPAALVTLTGTVIELTEVLGSLGIEADPGPIAKQVVLRGEDGTLTPLLSDDASRALFEDERLRGRKAELRVRRHPGLPYVQVMLFRIEDQGRLCVADYYCDVCTISVRAPQICSCCQGPMELRLRSEEP